MAHIEGTSGDDILSGTVGIDDILGFLGNDRIDGGAGNDFIFGGGGDDIIDGGADFDTVFIDNFVNSNPVEINLLTGTAVGPESGNDTLINIEHVVATGLGDITIIGSNGDDVLQAYGYARNVVSGGSGDDIVGDNGHASILDGGSGQNSLTLYRNQLFDGQNYTTVTTPFTQSFTPGVNGTLADGTTYSNFDFFFVNTGSGDDNVTFSQLKRRPSPQSFFANGFYAGDGNDTVTIDQSASASPLLMAAPSGGFANLSDNGSPGTADLLLLSGVENFRFICGSGNDRLTTGAGSDIFTGGGGDDTLDGGSGPDVARYSGLVTDYQVTRISSTIFQIKDLRSGTPDGTDTLSNIERLQWGDGGITALFNSAPVVTTSNRSVSVNQTLSLASLITVSDADGDAMTRYQLYDNSADPNSGHFVVGGVAQSARTVIDLTAAQAAQTSFVTGRAGDDLQIRAYDGLAWSAADNANWAPFTITVPANHAPVATTHTARVSAAQTVALSSLISVSDADGDGMASYQLYDNSSDPSSGHFVVNGVAQPAHTTITLTAGQAPQTSFVTGTVNDDLQIRVSDGLAWSAADSAAWAPFTIGPLVNNAPVVTTGPVSASRGQTLALSSLIAVSDADGDAMTRYQLYDNSSDPSSGHFVVNGVTQSARTVIDLTAALAAQTSFVTGTVNDDLQIRAYDGQAWSASDGADWAPFTVTVPANRAPVVTTSTLAAHRGQTIALSSLISVSDADGDAMTRYQLYDNSSDPSSGHFVVNGVIQSARTVIDLTAAQAAQTSFVTGKVNDDLQIRVFDGLAWSAADSADWAPFSVTVPANHAPVVTSADARVAAGQTIALSSLISISDADGDAMTRYQLYDNSSDPNSGHFLINGVVQSARMTIELTAAQAAQTSFVTGTLNDDLQIRAFDGLAWSAADSANWAPFTIGPAVNHAPVLTTADTRIAAGQTVSLASLLSISDADGDAMTRYQLYDNSRDPASGHFTVNGVTQSAGMVIDLTAAQAAQTSFVTGTLNDDLQIRVFDGKAWSAADSANWAPFTIGPTVNHAPVVTTADVTTTPGQTLSLASLMTVSDADNDAMTRYQLYDNSSNPNSGHFVINGVAQSARTVIDISAAQFAQTSFLTGTLDDDIQVRAFDGRAWSAADNANWAPFHITA